MAGTRLGGIKAAETNKQRHGKDFYQKIGAAGGIKSRGGGFAANSTLAQYAGRVGGIKSRRNGSTDIDFEKLAEAKVELKDYRRLNK